jgi:hypothetical protein
MVECAAHSACIPRQPTNLEQGTPKEKVYRFAANNTPKAGLHSLITGDQSKDVYTLDVDSRPVLQCEGC